MKTKKKRMVHYTLEQLEALRKKGATGTDWERVLNMSQAEANRLAESDLDDPVHEFIKSKKRLKAKKIAISKRSRIMLSLDPEVARFYKHHGNGWQNTINAVLKAYMLVQEHRV